MAFRRTYRKRTSTKRRFTRRPKRYGRRFKARRTELKILEAQTTTPITTTAQGIVLNRVRLGTGSQGRIGDKIFMTSLQLKGYIQNPDDYDIRYIRMLIVFDKQANQTAPAITDILTASDVTAMRNLDHRYRFSILMDKLMKFDGESVSDAARVISVFKRINKPVCFGQDGGTYDYSDINYGTLWMFLLSTDATDGSSIKLSYRLRYTDN